MANFNKRIISFILPQFLFILSASAYQIEDGAPVIYSCTPQFIQQGQITTSIVSGENLHSTVIGVSGGDVFAVILKEDQEGKNLTIQFAVKPTSEPGEREFFLRNSFGQEAKFPIKVIPTGAPTIESVYPNTATPGSTVLLYITGMGLNNPLVTTTSDQFLVNSYRPSSDGSVLYLSVSLTPNTVPGVYQIYINTIGGQAQADFTVSSTTSTELDSFSADPYSPGIYSVEVSSQDKNQIILKGAMFDPAPINNMVTLLENNDGTVTGREVTVIYSNNNEIVIKLPQDVDVNSKDSISFAVSSNDGKSSNIKTVDLDALYNNYMSSSNSSNESTEDSSTHIDIASAGNSQTINNPTQPHTGTVSNSAINIAENNQTNSHKDNDSQTDTNKANDKATDKSPEKNEKVTTELPNPGLVEDINIIQNLSQYLFSNPSNNEIKREIDTPTIDEIQDPAKLISTIEETKLIKNQTDLIMLALNEAKENQDLSETIKKAETLKNKVEELENLLNAEKQKNNPNPRKLVKYQQLLATANTESRSQSFELFNNLLKYKPQLKNLLSQKPFDLAAIQPNIPSDAIILQYVPTEEGLIIFVVDNKNLKTRINKNISKDIVNREVQAYRQLFEKEIEKIKLTGRVTPVTSWKDDKSNTYKKEIRPLKEKSVFLYNNLIGPVERDIASKKTIAIIANGWLRYLPFQSLGKLTKDGDLSFLISNKSIVYLDSVLAVSKTIQPSLSSMSIITVLANPDGTLNGANKEAEIIATLFAKTTTALIQKPFNTSLINQVAKKADILHLATHGFLDGTDINASYLVSGKQQNKGKIRLEKLFLKDIYDLNLNNSKLIVLSGCDTGKIGTLLNEPDDIVGSLATAFRVAGANTILASLWKAHDEATKIIMQSFYENIKLGVDKAEALRRAELKVKGNPQYGHPLFWSLFSLIGDWR